MADLEKCYSINDEDFNFTSVGDLFDHLDSEGELVEGRFYYEADCRRIKPSGLVSAESVIETIGYAMWEEVGEIADCYPDVTTEAKSELQELLDAWLIKHADPSNFWQTVGKSRVVAVTEQDVIDQQKGSE